MMIKIALLDLKDQPYRIFRSISKNDPEIQIHRKCSDLEEVFHGSLFTEIDILVVSSNLLAARFHSLMRGIGTLRSGSTVDIRPRQLIAGLNDS